MTAEEIKGLRLKLKMTQTEFGAIFYKGKTIVSEWESGKKSPTRRVAVAMKEMAIKENKMVNCAIDKR